MKRKEIYTLLEKFIQIESVSADSNRFPEVVNASGFLKKILIEIGFEVKVISKENAPPLIVASYRVKNASKTIGIYGHYDVQAEDPVHEWNSNPYTLIEQKGKFWARGTADNKGHIVQNIAAIADLIKKNQLRNSVVFILEGEEETGSVHLEDFVLKAKKELSDVDVFYVTDTGMYSKEQPQIFYALRGLVYFELKVIVGTRDLHSGMYGNSVPNPALIAAEIMGMMKDNTTGEVLIPGFYDDVRDISSEERTILESIRRSDDELMKEAGVSLLQSLKGENPSLASKVLPSLDINGMVSGYTGEGPKTIIPKSATVKFSCRLVEQQNPKRIRELVANFIESSIADNVDYRLDILSEDNPFYTNIEETEVKRAAAILEKEFSKPVIFNRSGGSIPAAEVLQRFFHKPVILTGFTLPDDNIHSPNENMDVELFWKGIEVLKKLYS